MSYLVHLVKIFTLWEFVKAHALTRLRHAELVSASIPLHRLTVRLGWTLKQVQGDGWVRGDGWGSG
jgi:hypothetical protein